MQMAAKVAYAIQKEAKRRCPVDTGRMRNSINVENAGDGFEVTVGVDYAPHVEYLMGSVENPETMWKAKAKRGGNDDSTIPFFRPAIYDVLGKLERGDL